MNVSPMKQPSALLPIAMSVAALALVLGHVAIFGVVHEADEGTAAHLWQLLIAGQVPVVAYFALKWLPRAPGQASRVLALQAVAALAACAPYTGSSCNSRDGLGAPNQRVDGLPSAMQRAGYAHQCQLNEDATTLHTRRVGAPSAAAWAENSLRVGRPCRPRAWCAAGRARAWFPKPT